MQLPIEPAAIAPLVAAPSEPNNTDLAAEDSPAAGAGDCPLENATDFLSFILVDDQPSLEICLLSAAPSDAAAAPGDINEPAASSSSSPASTSDQKALSVASAASAAAASETEGTAATAEKNGSSTTTALAAKSDGAAVKINATSTTTTATVSSIPSPTASSTSGMASQGLGRLESIFVRITKKSTRPRKALASPTKWCLTVVLWVTSPSAGSQSEPFRQAHGRATSRDQPLAGQIESLSPLSAGLESKLLVISGATRRSNGTTQRHSSSIDRPGTSHECVLILYREV